MIHPLFIIGTKWAAAVTMCEGVFIFFGHVECEMGKKEEKKMFFLAVVLDLDELKEKLNSKFSTKLYKNEA